MVQSNNYKQVDKIKADNKQLKVDFMKVLIMLMIYESSEEKFYSNLKDLISRL